MKAAAMVLVTLLVLMSGLSAGRAEEESAELDRTVLPIPEPVFRGRIGLTPADSEKDFPRQVEAPEGAPNVVIIMTDDVGFAASETFGGPIPTPAFDRVAKAGLRYNRFHTTAQCSPTRAALLTGRNHHTAGTGSIMEMGIGYPGYNTLVSKKLAGLGTILKLNGWNTAWFGKNHNVPDWQTSQVGPFDLWPSGLGFEYFYGFIGGDTNQWAPALVEDHKAIEPPHDDPDYHFDGGWDALRQEIFERQKRLGVIPQDAELTPRPEAIKAWDSLDPERKKVFARMMEVYAGALAHCDYQINRFLDALEETGRMDNTLLIYIMGDNGGSGEGGAQGMLNEMTIFNGVIEDFDDIKKAYDTLGGPMHFNHMPAAWAHATSTPFQWTKLVASHFGGTRNAMAVSWPKRIKDKGGLRQQFHHVIDILPTVLECCGLPEPVTVNGFDQKPVEGVSMAYTFDDAEAEGRRVTQYFEIYARRGVYHDGWVAATTPKTAPWIPGPPSKNAHTEYAWELYNVDEDFSEAHDLAAQFPERLQALKDLFIVEATKYNVLPLDDSNIGRFDVANRPSNTMGRDTFTYHEGQVRIPEGSAPDLKNRSWDITAKIAVPEKGAEGILITQGGRFNGIGLWLEEGKPVFCYNFLGLERTTVASPTALAKGDHEIVVHFRYKGGKGEAGGPADLELVVDGAVVATGRIEKTIPIRFSLDETLDIGEDTGTPVSEDYRVPFKFTGELETVTIDLR